MSEGRLAVIGGSGLYGMPGLENVEIVELSTPFGNPSSPITLGSLNGKDVAFIARHGRHHSLLPSEVPYRANIFALKSIGVERVLSVSAVGSLREEYAPLDVVVPDQLFDRTKNRPSTFFGSGIVAHVAMAQPFCPALRELVRTTASASRVTTHHGGCLVVMEGPQFSTVAESRFYRDQGFAVIGMTALPEAKLAREAELCYATLAMVTDYDVWHGTHEAVTSDMVIANLRRNTEVAHEIMRGVVESAADIGSCGCQKVLDSALVTDLRHAPIATVEKLEPILGRRIAVSRSPAV